MAALTSCTNYLHANTSLRIRASSVQLLFRFHFTLKFLTYRMRLEGSKGWKWKISKSDPFRGSTGKGRYPDLVERVSVSKRKKHSSNRISYRISQFPLMPPLIRKCRPFKRAWRSYRCATMNPKMLLQYKSESNLRSALIATPWTPTFSSGTSTTILRQ